MYAKETLDCFLKLTTPTLHQSNNPTRVPPHASCVGEAWYQLGEWYRLGQAEGNVQPYLAYQAFSKASKLGHLLATYRKAVCCEFSWGKKKVNEKKALRLYRICAKAGLCQAALKLGFIYLHGLCHEQIDLDSSLLWLKKAASETPPSLFSLHAGYMIGQRYEKMNHKERSFSFYLDTAQLGYPASMFQVALCYQEGKGVNKHPGLAQKWFRNAKAHGITHLAQITNLPLPT
ncbi:hypothetical protein HMI55_005087 [Coelomomyces lativittatus]|nr:hypothetical protein HMI55_005087 [Coelomomyces lativittatus]